MTMLDDGYCVLSWGAGDAQIVNFTTSGAANGLSTIKVEIRVADSFTFSNLLQCLHDARQLQKPLRRAGKAQEASNG